MPDPATLSLGSDPTPSEKETERHPPLPQEWMGGYRLLRRIGEGGMGVVYEAEQQTPRRRVALKVIRGGLGVDEQQVKMFEREAAALGRLKHPGIATIYEMGRTTEGQSFFAMELVQGVSISDCLAGRGGKEPLLPRELRARLALFIKICDAVSYAHQRGVIHRDLKPSNVLLTSGSERRTTGRGWQNVPEVKVLDFGLAQITDPDARVTRSLVETGVQGTLAYMSPEQAAGNPDEIDLRTDIYSLGVLLFELLTESLPYQTSGVTPLEALRIITEARPLAPSRALRVRLDREVDTIVLKALEKEPCRRYQTVPALAEDVERYLNDQPILARPPTATYQLRKLVRRHKAAFASLAAFLVLLAGFAVTMTVERNRAIAAERRAAAEAETARRVSGFLVELFRISDPGEALGRRVTARELLDQGAQRIGWELRDQPLVRATLLETMGKAYQSLGLYDSAEPLLRSALDSRRAVQGPRHPETAATQNSLGELLMLRGQYEAAESLLREALALQRAALGEHAQVADTAVNLASLLQERGKYVEAESLHEEALALRRRLLGEEHRDVAQSLNNLANLYYSKANYASAVPLLRQALAINRKVLGAEHPEVATTLNNLGMMLVAQGEYGEAEERLRESLAMRRKLFGNEHLDVAQSLNNLGYLFSTKADKAAAEPFYREAVDLRRKLLGTQHPLVANSLNNLAGILSAQGDYDGAERLQREVLAIRTALFGEEHPAVAQSLNNLAMLLQKRKRFDEARTLMEKALAIIRRAMGPEHPEAANYLFNLGRLARTRGDNQEALRLLDEALALRRKLLPEGHPDIASALFQKASVLLEMRRFGETEPLLLEAYGINTAKMGETHAYTKATRDLLVRLYETWGRPERAASYRSAK